MEEMHKVYDAKVVLRRTGRGNFASVQIRYTKKGISPVKIVQFPDYIKENEIRLWRWYRGEQIAVYHRRGKDDYLDGENQAAPSELCHGLERLVNEIHSRISKSVGNTLN